jgi:LysM repeat protein
MNKNFSIFFIIPVISIIGSACSPIKSSPEEEKHKMELTLHEVQTNLDDSRHDLNCFRTELQIIDSKIKHLENSIASMKQDYFEKMQSRFGHISDQIGALEKKTSGNEKKQDNTKTDLHKLSNHANETSEALSQYKQRMNEMEKEILKQSSVLGEITKLKGTLEMLAHSIQNTQSDSLYDKIYRVRAGDSLEKIARHNKVSVESIKKINHLENDLIVIGQELKIPGVK